MYHRLAAAALASVLIYCLAAAATAKSERIRVVWQEDPSTSATIGWDQLGGGRAVLHYGIWNEDEDPLDQTAQVDRTENYMGMRNQFVHLSGLTSDARYRFQIRDDDGSTAIYWFRTAPAAPQPFSFIAGGDTKTDPIGRFRCRRTNRYVPKLRPLFIVFVGDLTSDGFDARDWQRWLADWSADTRTDDGRLFPIVPVRGNHEPDSEILDKLFGLKDARNYFAFNIGGDLLRVYALNSEINIEKDRPQVSRADATPALEEQTAWFLEDLAEHQGVQYKLAAYHKPFRPHTSRKGENDYLYNRWAHLFYEYRVTMAVEGDSHLHKITYPIRPATGDGAHEGFVRDDARGTLFLGEGSWGALPRSADDLKPWTMQAGSFAQFKWVHVYPDHLEIRTVITEEAAGPAANSEENLFAVPADVQLFAPDDQGDVVRYPLAAE